MTKIFKPLIGRTMEVYIDDIVVKSKTRSEHALHLEKKFCLMKAYNMKLNPTKYAFGVNAGKFLGFMVTQRGIGVNPGQIKVVMETPALSSKKELQCLTSRLATLASRALRSKIGLLLQSPIGEQLEQAIQLGFLVSNNEAEYEGEYVAKDERMAQYLSNVQANLEKLSEWVVKRIPRTKNVQVDALSRIATTLPMKEAVLLPIYLQVSFSIAAPPIYSASETGISWMHEIETYILIGKPSEENKQAHKIRV
ncbi:hypothetical protein CK203_097974 [Vitis vinifera]|uniref:Reverse transcriptase domain-containing protein n=1 Tax=Vitis vinifera TaxID=29760 RepID=A0A438CXX3_VITVI|nr:hypothetical protein CK203_097974 [Vitis vinifera]